MRKKKKRLGKNEKKILRKLKQRGELFSKEIFPKRKIPISSFDNLERKGLIKYIGAGRGTKASHYIWKITSKGKKQKI